MAHKILVTGGTGTLGHAIVTELLKTDVESIRVFSRNEYNQWQMSQEIKDKRVRYLIGDVRDKDRLMRAMKGIDSVIHTAALKHVDICEYNPIEAVTNNIDGSRNIVDCALDNGVQKVLAVSSDKAVNPVNIYGATKLAMEKLFIYSNVYGSKFSCVRFGNFIGSHGSFVELIKKGGVINVTDTAMTRYWIETQDAAKFVLDRLEDMQGGEIFVPKMKEMFLMDIVKQYVDNPQIKIVGKRKGEKMREELVNSVESAEDMGDYWVIKG